MTEKIGANTPQHNVRSAAELPPNYEEAMATSGEYRIKVSIAIAVVCS